MQRVATNVRSQIGLYYFSVCLPWFDDPRQAITTRLFLIIGSIDPLVVRFKGPPGLPNVCFSVGSFAKSYYRQPPTAKKEKKKSKRTISQLGVRSHPTKGPPGF